MARRRRSAERARPRPGNWRALGVLGALALGGSLLGACGNSATSATTGSSSTTTTPTTTSAPSTTTSTTTTTTLPRPTRVAGSDVTWATGNFGLAHRLPVIPVPDGALVAPAAPLGSPQAGAAVSLGYYQVGSGPDLMLIMGQRGSTSWWDPQLIADLAAHFRVTYFDLPGIGYSAPASGARSVETLADLTAGLSDELGLSAPVVLGWGLGGDVALALAERHPALVARLVLVDTSAGAAGPQAAPAVRAALADPGRTLTEISRLFFPAGADVARQAWLARLAEISPDDVTATGVAGAAALAAALANDHALLARAPTVTAPVLLITGGKDVIVPPANAAVLASHLHHVRRLSLPGAGYASLAQDEPRVAAAVTAFAGS